MSELKLGQDKKYLERKAADQGLSVFLPRPREIFLDLDDGALVNERIMDYLTINLGVSVLSKLTTTSLHNNQHVYLRLDRDLNDLERVIFQACLGSDPVKELFSFMQLGHVLGIMEGMICECPVALFETEAEAAKVEMWRATDKLEARP